ncbi:hypothetical protein [Streptomyces iakyrus]
MIVTKSEGYGTNSAMGSITSKIRCPRHVAPPSMFAKQQSAGG